MYLEPWNTADEISIVLSEINTQVPGHHWTCHEIGNGNINFIYLVEDGEDQLIVKKDLGFARINPIEFPLSEDRLGYEYKAYLAYREVDQERIPVIHFFSSEKSILCMEYLHPHVSLREGLLSGKVYPRLAEHLGAYLAKTSYLRSKYHLSRDVWEEEVAKFSQNTGTRQIILDLNFTEPFSSCLRNSWSSPELDSIAKEIAEDPLIHTVVQDLKYRFLNDLETLSHGDLHTGSIFVTPDDTKIIDMEFATYAPMSFDLGMLFGNFMMAAFAADAHGLDRMQIIETTCKTWDVFAKTLEDLWDVPSLSYEEKISEVWLDTLRLAGVEIIRRTIGLAHVADFESIQDRTKKTAAEKKALEFAKKLLLDACPNSQDLFEQLQLATQG